jgi:hypothetical protein
MAFTFTNYPILTPEQQSPWQGALSRALDTYSKVTKSSYLPKQMETDLFAKEIGPVAALASSPNFTGFNPQIQKLIAQRIGAHFGAGGGEGAQAAGMGESTPGYADDSDIYGRLEKGADVALTPGGQSKVYKSRWAGEAEKIGLPAAIVKKLGGTEAAGEAAAFNQAIDEGVKRLTLKGYSAHDAKQMLQPHSGETKRAYLERVKPLFVEKEQKGMAVDEDGPVKSVEEKMARDDQERADAEATAAAFGTTPEKVMEALSMGVKTKKEFEEFLKWSAQ